MSKTLIIFTEQKTKLCWRFGYETCHPYLPYRWHIHIHCGAMSFGIQVPTF